MTEADIKIFNNPTSTKEEAKLAREYLFSILLNLLPSEATRDAAELGLFNAKVITGVTAFKCTSLPPTSAAALEHSLRVNHQV